MIYKNTNFKVLIDTLTETIQKRQEVRHYPYSNESVVIDKGKEATIITATIKAESISEKNTIKEILHSPGKGELEITEKEGNNYFYKKVTTGSTGDFEPLNPGKTAWSMTAEFIALNPLAYDSESGEKIYD